MNTDSSKNCRQNGGSCLVPSTPEEWNEVWIEAQRACRTSGRNRECWEAWDDIESASLYWEKCSARDEKNGRIADLLNLTEPLWSVLDIGAGPGNLSVPLAEKASWVTAVEPAKGMASVLAKNVEERGLSNLEIVQKRWDDVDPEKDLREGYDLVIASYSFGMLDLLSTIKKILKVARGEVVFYWHAGPQVWDLDAEVLWPLLHGRSFHPIPKANIIFNLLYSMKIYPNVVSIPNSYRMTFSNMEEAMATYRSKFDVDPGDREKSEKLAGYLSKTLLNEGEQLSQRACNTGMRISFNVTNL